MGVVAGPSECVNLWVHYFKSAKARRLVGRLGKGADVLPLRLWCHCGENHYESGRLPAYAESEIESICEWWGARGEMIRVFLDLNVLVKDGQDWIVNDFVEWNGHIRALKAKGRANRQKQLKKIAIDADSDPSSPATSQATCEALTGLDCAVPPKPPKGGGRSRRGRLEEKRSCMLEELSKP